MGQLPDWIGNFPFPPDKKRPIVITRSQTKQFIYPDKPENSDFNWNYASTDKFFIAQYQLSPGVKFMPADVHTGDEVYYVVEGTLTMFNPETGEVHQVEENECSTAGCRQRIAAADAWRITFHGSREKPDKSDCANRS